MEEGHLTGAPKQVHNSSLRCVSPQHAGSSPDPRVMPAHGSRCLPIHTGQGAGNTTLQVRPGPVSGSPSPPTHHTPQPMSANWEKDVPAPLIPFCCTPRSTDPPLPPSGPPCSHGRRSSPPRVATCTARTRSWRRGRGSGASWRQSWQRAGGRHVRWR